MKKYNQKLKDGLMIITPHKFGGAYIELFNKKKELIEELNTNWRLGSMDKLDLQNYLKRYSEISIISDILKDLNI